MTVEPKMNGTINGLSNGSVTVDVSFEYDNESFVERLWVTDMLWFSYTLFSAIGELCLAKQCTCYAIIYTNRPYINSYYIILALACCCPKIIKFNVEACGVREARVQKSCEAQSFVHNSHNIYGLYNLIKILKGLSSFWNFVPSAPDLKTTPWRFMLSFNFLKLFTTSWHNITTATLETLIC